MKTGGVIVKRISVFLSVFAILFVAVSCTARGNGSLIPDGFLNCAAGAENTAGSKASLDFTVYDPDGLEVHLSDYIGRPVVVNFWATWCGHCIEELPAFQKVYSEYGDRIAFLMIDIEDDPVLAAAYVQAMGYTFPVCFDMEYDALLTYQVAEVPCTLMFDAEGRQVRRQTGSMTLARLEYCVGQLLPEVDEEEVSDVSVGVIGSADGPTAVYLTGDPVSVLPEFILSAVWLLAELFIIRS